MGQFHKSIDKRMDAFGVRIDKVWKDTFDFEEEIHNFCVEKEAAFDRYHNFNIKTGEVLNDPDIPETTKGMLEVQNDTDRKSVV